MTVLVALAAADRGDAAGTPAEEQVAAGFAPRRRREFLRARTLLRWAVGRHLGVDPAGVEIGTAPGGRPVVAGRPGVAVSIAHSEAVHAVAVARAAGVGIDVEAPVRPDPGLIRRICAPAGRGALTALPEPVRTRAFTTLWTVHEACVKATGEGLRGRPWRVAAPVGARRGTWRHVRWTVLPPYLGNQLALALAGPPDGRVQVIRAPDAHPLHELDL